MPPEVWTFAMNSGFPALIVVYGIFIFHTAILPELKAHFTSVAQMTEAIKQTASNGVDHKNEIAKVEGKVDELLVRIPQRSHDREAS